MTTTIAGPITFAGGFTVSGSTVSTSGGVTGSGSAGTLAEWTSSDTQGALPISGGLVISGGAIAVNPGNGITTAGGTVAITSSVVTDNYTAPTDTDLVISGGVHSGLAGAKLLLESPFTGGGGVLSGGVDAATSNGAPAVILGGDAAGGSAGGDAVVQAGNAGTSRQGNVYLIPGDTTVSSGGCVLIQRQAGGTGLPTSPTGLPPGALWNSGGFVKIV